MWAQWHEGRFSNPMIFHWLSPYITTFLHTYLKIHKAFNITLLTAFNMVQNIAPPHILNILYVLWLLFIEVSKLCIQIDLYFKKNEIIQPYLSKVSYLIFTLKQAVYMTTGYIIFDIFDG